jgi:hypothetical protein
MNLAQQKSVIQKANMSLVSIRLIELRYFQLFFANLGINSALFIGFIAGSIAQIPSREIPTGCWVGWALIYNYSSAITMAAAIFALIITTFTDMFALGLGLRGPIGSMVISITGMIDEQQTMLYAFIITVTFFGLQQITMYFLMMDKISGWVTGMITLVAMIFWYRYALRLYNRFKWKIGDEAHLLWDGKLGSDPTSPHSPHKLRFP